MDGRTCASGSYPDDGSGRMPSTDRSVGIDAAVPWPSAIRAWLWVFILLIAYSSAFADRQVLSLLVDHIKADLHVSDTAFGLLQGLSFALLYATAGVPIGHLVDRKSRRTIIACGVFTWSVMTALCGTASHYGQLFLYRVGVGVGEGSLSPAAFPIMADLFPPRRLPLAVSVYTTGAGLGAGTALLVGGRSSGSWPMPGRSTCPCSGC